MNNTDPVAALTAQDDREKRLQDQVGKLITTQDLELQRQLVHAFASALNISVLDCAAALLKLNDELLATVKLALTKQTNNQKNQGQKAQKSLEQPAIKQPGIRLVRYRLNLGIEHNVTLEEIKSVLVEESGVDIKNICNPRILDSFTLIDLPDEMPQEIFHHLRAVEIKGQKLDIRRVKARNKKRPKRRHPHAKTYNSPSSTEAAQ